MSLSKGDVTAPPEQVLQVLPGHSGAKVLHLQPDQQVPKDEGNVTRANSLKYVRNGAKFTPTYTYLMVYMKEVFFLSNKSFAGNG